MLIGLENGDYLDPSLISAIIVNHIGSPCVTIHWGKPCGFVSVVPYESLDQAKEAAKQLAWQIQEALSQEQERLRQPDPAPASLASLADLVEADAEQRGLLNGPTVPPFGWPH